MNWLTFIADRALCPLLLALGCACLSTPGRATPVTLYSTQFEAAEGFDLDFDLAGQGGWINAGSGGNGLLPEDPVYGQSAYIGFDPPTTNGLAVWKPVNHNPSTLPIVNVTLDMWVIDSTTNRPHRDQFSWEVYNTQGDRLFALIFDNSDLGIYHQLDNDPFGTYSGWTFTNDALYAVEIEMNFQSNLWNAWVEGVQVITNKLITTTGAPLAFGDIDAVWLPVSTNGAGDNYLIFDNLAITADALASPAAVLHPPVPVSGGRYLLRVDGVEEARYVVEASTNLTTWTALKTNVVTGGYFDYLDTTSPGLPRRFYRARWLP